MHIITVHASCVCVRTTVQYSIAYSRISKRPFLLILCALERPILLKFTFLPRILYCSTTEKGRLEKAVFECESPIRDRERERESPFFWFAAQSISEQFQKQTSKKRGRIIQIG